MNELFRREAADEPGGRIRGRVLVMRPLGGGALAGLLLGAVTAAAVYLARTDYDRHQVVPGRLEPSTGMVWVRAPASGRLAAIEVQDGDEVAAGDTLAVVDPDRRQADGSMLTPALRAAIEDELQGLDAAITAERARRVAAQHSLDAQLDSARAAAALLKKRKAVAAHRLGLARKRTADIRSLAARRFVSRHDAELAGDQVLGLQEQLLDLVQQRALLDGRVRQLDAQRREARDRWRVGDGDYLKERAVIRQRLIQADAAGSFAIDAPVAGRVSALLVHAGETVGPSRPVLALCPTGGTLVARLYVPSRAAGFLAAGQAVRLMLDAYPHQQFGILPGHVTSIARTAVSPAYISDAASSAAGAAGTFAGGEPVYPVTVEIGRAPSFAALTLRSGMTLHADLVLERHSLLDWWLRPLQTLGARI